MATETTQDLKLEIKQLILETLSITDVNIKEIDDEKPLFGSDNPLTLDSVDALEIIMAIQRKYNVRIGDQNLARNVVHSINSIAEFLEAENIKHSI
ncbi:MAG: phosphopantetheine-binding protein [Bacteroidota bacterium]|nr:phosphopantetheine-binding protein [Bacteroidota bacterium]